MVKDNNSNKGRDNRCVDDSSLFCKSTSSGYLQQPVKYPTSQIAQNRHFRGTVLYWSGTGSHPGPGASISTEILYKLM